MHRENSRADVVNIDDVTQDVHFLSEQTLQDIAKGQLVKLALTSEDSP